MRNFSMLALEERIVLDATLLSTLLTFNINAGDSVDLSGPDHYIPGNAYTFRNTPNLSSSGGHFIDASTGQMIGNNPSLIFGLNSGGGAGSLDWGVITSGMAAVQFNAAGQHLIQFDFTDPALGANLTVAIVNVAAPPDPIIVNPVTGINGQEGSSANNVLLGTITTAGLPDLVSLTSSNPDLVLSGLSIVSAGAGPLTYELRGNISYNDVGSGTFSIGISDSMGFIATFNVNATATDAPITEIDLPQINSVEGSSLLHLEIARFTNANPLGDPSLVSNVFVTGNVSLTPSQIEYNAAGGYYSVVLDAQFRNVVSSGGFTVILQDSHDGTNLSLFTPLRVTDAPLTAGTPITVLADPGLLFSGKVGSFVDGNPFEVLANYNGSVINWGDGTSSAATLVSLGNGAYDVYGSHTYAANPAGLAATFTIKDGVEGLHDGSFNLISSAPILVPGSVVSASGIEGQFFNDLNLLSFTSADPNAQASDFSTSLDINGIGSPIASILSLNDVKLTKDALGVFHFTADVRLGTDTIPFSVASTIVHIASGQQISATGSVDVTQAPKTLGATVSLNLPLGLSNMVKIGSFTDANPFEPLGNYRVLPDNDSTIAGNGGATGILVQTGSGTYDVYANLNYSSSGVKTGTFLISEIDSLGNAEPGSILSGTFNVTVSAPSQLLWGVDENSGKLFSVADYSQPGAENRVTLYGQIHTASGVIIGGGIDAFTIDAADANGKNAAYIAISKAVAGINTFSIGVIADINDLAHNTEVKLYSISGMSFNMSKDAITGLAVDPITGNLMGTVVSGGTKSTLFVVDKNSLQPASQVAKAYALGTMVGSDDTGTQLGTAINQFLGLFGINDLIGGLKVNNARDMAFDSAGRLFVTDGAKDILYQINVGNGEIIGIANAKEANGLAINPNIEALAWDPVAGKLIGANSVAGQSDLIGLSVTGGANSLSVANLQNLQDIQGMAFKPQFAYHSGQDLGTLIDFANVDVEYRAGDSAIFLLKSVDLVTFGDNNYGGGSLNVDVGDNANSLTDQLAISNSLDIKVVGSEVRYKGLLIGMIDAIENGKNGKDLTIHFNANAGEKAVEALMNRITYMNTASSLVLGDKSVAFTLLDSLGSVIGYTTVDIEIEKKYF